MENSINDVNGDVSREGNGGRGSPSNAKDVKGALVNKEAGKVEAQAVRLCLVFTSGTINGKQTWVVVDFRS